jgi:PAS domain S-box-containing protein
MAEEVEGTSGPIGRCVRRTRRGVLETLATLAKRGDEPTIRTFVKAAVQGVQMINFVTLATTPGGGGTGAKSGFATVAGAIGPLTNIFTVISTDAALFVYWIAVTWVAAFISLFAFCVFSFATERFHVLWPLKLLSLIASYSANEAFIPLLTALMAGFSCGQGTRLDLWAKAGISCLTTVFAAQVVVTAVLTVVFVALCFTFALVFFDSDPCSNNISARAHGRVDAVFLAINIALVLSVNVFNQFSSIGHAFIFGLCGIAWLGSYVFFMPFYSALMNRSGCAVSALFLWAVACFVLQTSYFVPDTGYVFLVGSPLALLSGLALFSARANCVMRTPPARLISPYDIEIKARLVVHDALYGHITDRIGLSVYLGGLRSTRMHPGAYTALSVGGDGGADAAPRNTFARSSAGATFARTGASASVAHGRSSVLSPVNGGAAAMRVSSRSRLGGGHDGGRGGAAAAPRGSASTVGDESDEDDAEAAGGGTRDQLHVENIEDADAADDIEVRRTVVRHLLPEALVAELQQMYRAGVSRFRTSAVLHIFFSRFYFNLLGNRHMQLSHLLQAERRSPPIDVSFMAFTGRRSAEVNAAGPDNALSAVARVAFEKHMQDARYHVLRAALRQVAFFTELVEPTPELSRLHSLSAQIMSSISTADNAFRELLALSPMSIAVMRLNSAFQSYVSRNFDKAAALVAEATRVEQQLSKERSSEGNAALLFMSFSQLSVMGESTALATLGGASRNLGLISSANASLLKTFGYRRIQLERRPVWELMPPAVGAPLERMLLRYVATGEGDLASTRVVFGLHRSGYVFPMLFSLRESSVEDGPPALLFAARPINTAENFILLTPEFALLAATQGSYSALGVALGATITEYTMNDWVPSFESLVPALLGPHGAEISFVPQFDAAVRGGRRGSESSDGSGGGDGGGSDADSAAAAADEDDGDGGGAGASMPSAAGATRATVGAKDTLSAHLQLVSGHGARSSRFYVLSWRRAQRVAPRDTLKVQDLKARRRSVAPVAMATSLSLAALAASPRPPHEDAGALLFGGSADDAESAPAAAPEAPDGEAATVAGPPPPPPDAPFSLQRAAPVLPPDAQRGGGSVSSGTVKSTVRHSTTIRTMRTDATKSVSGRSGVDESGSIKSGSSTRSTTILRTVARLRRILDSAPSMLSGLQLLRIVGCAVVLLSIVLAIGMVILTDTQFESFGLDIVYTQACARRILINFNILMALEVLIHDAKGCASRLGGVRARGYECALLELTPKSAPTPPHLSGDSNARRARRVA